MINEMLRLFISMMEVDLSIKKCLNVEKNLCYQRVQFSKGKALAAFLFKMKLLTKSDREANSGRLSNRAPFCLSSTSNVFRLPSVAHVLRGLSFIWPPNLSVTISMDLFQRGDVTVFTLGIRNRHTSMHIWKHISRYQSSTSTHRILYVPHTRPMFDLTTLFLIFHSVVSGERLPLLFIFILLQQFQTLHIYTHTHTHTQTHTDRLTGYS